jgi:hypothetical protein
MSSHKPWTPEFSDEAPLHPFGSPDGQKMRSTLELRNPEEDTEPLQGTKDISGADSLQDVIADAEEKEHNR